VIECSSLHGQAFSGGAERTSPRQALRYVTEEAHLRLHELAWFTSLQRGTLSVRIYASILVRMLGLHEPLQALLAGYERHPALGWSLVPHDMAAPARLRRDLAVLGVSNADIEAAPRAAGILPRLKSPASALGCLWVLEGSAQGGRVIAKLLHERLGLTPSAGCAFFTPLPGQPKRWQACCDAVGIIGLDMAACAAMQQAATATMTAFADWMEAADTTC